MENLESIKTMTPNELRRYKGLENLSDQDAEEVVEGLKTFAVLSFRLYKQSLDNSDRNVPNTLEDEVLR